MTQVVNFTEPFFNLSLTKKKDSLILFVPGKLFQPSPIERNKDIAYPSGANVKVIGSAGTNALAYLTFLHEKSFITLTRGAYVMTLITFEFNEC